MVFGEYLFKGEKSDIDVLAWQGE